MLHNSKRNTGSLGMILLVLLLTAVPSWSTETVFTGGTLADLRRLSSSLTFDRLVIAGTLDLGLYGDTILSVNDLEITSSGVVTYTKPSCDHYRAPYFKVNAVSQVVINGSIQLQGETGTRTSGGTCNTCIGYGGGDVAITANMIDIGGSIKNNGGGGLMDVDSFGSYGCGGGNAGNISLKAQNIHLRNAEISTFGGSGGTGYSFGEENHGAPGAPGSLDLNASDLFEMVHGQVTTDGTLTLTAALTSICGPMTYGAMYETIGGAGDGTGPEVEILSPAANSDVDLGFPLEIRIRVRDLGTGVQKVKVTGLGHDQVHSGSEVINGILTVQISKVVPSSTVDVSAWDNKGNVSYASISGLRAKGGWTVEAGQIVTVDHDLDFGTGAITIAGKVILKKGTNVLITAGSLNIPSSGSIVLETSNSNVMTAPTLEIDVSGSATIDGTINLTGEDGKQGNVFPAPAATGEDGGTFYLLASSVSVKGTIRADGGNSKHGYQNCRDGGKGGKSLIIAGRDAVINGTISIKGGAASCDSSGGWGGNCIRGTGGNGGGFDIFYGTTYDQTGVLINYNGGTSAASVLCGSQPSTAGHYQSYNMSSVSENITASAGPGGTISPAGVTTVPWGTASPTFAIIPAPHYHIVDVTVNGQSVGNVASWTDDIVWFSYELKATFAHNPPVTLTVVREGPGTGTLTSYPSGITCGSDCVEDYQDNTEVILKASAAYGSTFSGWTETCTGKGICAVTLIDAPRTVKANFTLTQEGDINGDNLVDLKDTVLALQFLSMFNADNIRSDYVSSGADVDGNDKIGLAEAIYILQKVAGMR